MGSLVRYDLLVAEVTSYLTAEHELAPALQRILDRAVAGLDAATGSLLIRAEKTESAQLIAVSGGGDAADALHLNTNSGPAADCVASGSIILAENLAADPRWPIVANLATAANVFSGRSYPVRLGNSVIGALTLYSTQPWGTARPSHLGQTMADLAAVAIGLEPVKARQESVASRVRELVTDRVAISQATGMLTQFFDIDVRRAHRRLVQLAATEKVSTAQLARELISDRTVLDRL